MNYEVNWKYIIVEEKPCIYKIYRENSSKLYIGSTSNPKRRFICHKSDLYRNCHGNPYLQKTYNKHSKDVWIFEQIELVEKEELLPEKELYWISHFNTLNNKYGYNLNEFTDRKLGCSRINNLSEESIRKMAKKVSEKHKGKIPKNLSKIQQDRRRKVICYFNNILYSRFESITDAAIYFNIDKRTIYNQLKGKVRKILALPYYKFEYDI